MIDTPIFVLCRNEFKYFYFLPFYKAFSIGQCGILSMIDSPILSSPYIETKPHFLIFASFERFFSMAVWNTVDDTYSNFVFYIVTKSFSI